MHELLTILILFAYVSVSLSVMRLKLAAGRSMYTACRVRGVIRQIPLAFCSVLHSAAALVHLLFELAN